MRSARLSVNNCSPRLSRESTAPARSRPMPVAVDTNFLIALAAKDDDSLDALRMLQERLAAHRRLVPPTALLETGFLSRQQQQDHELAVLAKIALDKLVHEWRFEYGYVPPGQIGVVQQVAREIRWRGL